MTNTPQNSPLDLAAVFKSPATAATVERVVKYIGNVYDAASNRSEADRFHPFQSVEEFDLLMPTDRAYFDELNLCEAILRHSEGRLSDLEMKAVLDVYIESHVYVYRAGNRSVKAGDFDRWADCDLIYIYSPSNNKIAFTCNPVQAWLVALLHPGNDFRMVKLECRY